MTAEPYGRDVARFEAEHEGWRVGKGLEGIGYGARHLDERGVPHGRVVGARTLDELAGLVKAAEDAEFRDVVYPRPPEYG